MSSGSNMKCPSCAAAELVHDSRDLPYACNGEGMLIPAVTGNYCPACGEVILDMAESTRVSAAMSAVASNLSTADVRMEGQHSAMDSQCNAG